jgi:hypothetical protein
MKNIERAGSVIRKQGTTIVSHKILPKQTWKFIFKLAAVMVSWFFNKSIFMAIIAYLFPILYLAYILLSRGFANGTFMNIVNYYFI